MIGFIKLIFELRLFKHILNAKLRMIAWETYRKLFYRQETILTYTNKITKKQLISQIILNKTCNISNELTVTTGDIAQKIHR